MNNGHATEDQKQSYPFPWPLVIGLTVVITFVIIALNYQTRAEPVSVTNPPTRSTAPTN